MFMRIRLRQHLVMEPCKSGYLRQRRQKPGSESESGRSYEEVFMFTRMMIPLDGSKTAEKVLPYARFVAGTLKLPVGLLAVVDIVEMATHITAARASHLDTVI